MVADPLNEATLLALLGEGAERDGLDYKQTCDLNDPRDTVKIAKHIGAMQMEGGWIVVGADDHGAPTSVLDAKTAKLFDLATLKPKLNKYLPDRTRLNSTYLESDGRHFALVRIDPHPDVIAPMKLDGVYKDANGDERFEFSEGEVLMRDGSSSKRADVAAIRAARARIAEQTREEARADFEQATVALMERYSAEAVRGHLIEELDSRPLMEALLGGLRAELAAPVSPRTYLRLIADGRALQMETETAGNATYRAFRHEEPSGPALDEYRRREQQWLDDCERTLEPEAVAAIVRAQGLPNTGYFAISTRMSARLTILEGLSETPAEPEQDTMTLVRRALSAGQKLRVRVLHENDDGRARSLNDDPLFVWAKQTWRILAERLPEHADEFYGEDPELGSGHFALSFMIASKQSRSDYLETQLRLLRRLAEQGA